MIKRQCVACSNANVDGCTSSAHFDRVHLHRSLVPTDAGGGGRVLTASRVQPAAAAHNAAGDARVVRRFEIKLKRRRGGRERSGIGRRTPSNRIVRLDAEEVRLGRCERPHNLMSAITNVGRDPTAWCAPLQTVEGDWIAAVMRREPLKLDRPCCRLQEVWRWRLCWRQREA